MEPQLTVRCACGWETTGTPDAVVEAATDHGRRVHNMSATREQILATAIEAGGATAADAGTRGA